MAEREEPLYMRLNPVPRGRRKVPQAVKLDLKGRIIMNSTLVRNLNIANAEYSELFLDRENKLLKIVFYHVLKSQAEAQGLFPMRSVGKNRGDVARYVSVKSVLEDAGAWPDDISKSVFLRHVIEGSSLVVKLP